MRISESKLFQIIREELEPFLMTEVESSWRDYERDSDHIVVDGRYLSTLGEFRVVSSMRDKPDSWLGLAWGDAINKLQSRRELKDIDGTRHFELIDQRVVGDEDNQTQQVIVRGDSEASPTPSDTGDTGDTGEEREYDNRITPGNGVMLVSLGGQEYEVSLRSCSKCVGGGSLVLSRQNDNRKYVYAAQREGGWVLVGFDVLELRDDGVYMHTTVKNTGKTIPFEDLQEMTDNLGEERIDVSYVDDDDEEQRLGFVLL